MLIAVDHGNKQIKTVHTPPFTSGLIQSDTPGFGTDALAYINCKETPEVSVPVPNQAALEELILAILAKNQSYLKKQPEPKPSTAQQDAAISAASEPMPPADGAELEQWFGGQDGVASILNSLKMFEQD